MVLVPGGGHTGRRVAMGGEMICAICLGVIAACVAYVVVAFVHYFALLGRPR
jgi:hypothetical protein